MKLEIKHLTPYPKELQYILPDGRSIGYMGAVYLLTNEATFNIGTDITSPFGETTMRIEEAKPILRPLSDLTKSFKQSRIDIKFNFCKKVGLVPSGDHQKFLENKIKNGLMSWVEMKLLFYYRFDVFELIPQDLAIDINTIEP